MGPKVGFVSQRRATRNVEAEINVRNPKAGGMIDQVKHVPRAQPPPPLVRIIKEVNRRQAAGQSIDIANADQPLLQIIGPFLNGEGIVDKRIDIGFDVSSGISGPALGLGLIGMEAIVQR